MTKLANVYRLFVVYIAFILLPFCASIVTPSGGPKDKTPPRVVNIVPENYSTNFNAGIVKITFDEYIQLRGLRKQLIISPPMEQSPDFKVKNKTLIIEFSKRENNVLKENTTYTFNFGDAVCDITENNPFENFQYVFSTGDFLDSLSFTGKVEDAFNRKTEKGILVMLYECAGGNTDKSIFDSKCDSFPYKDVPNYFTKTNSSGEFIINNIKEGEYILFAMKDENRNYIYDLPNEQIAFLNNTVDPADSVEIHLSLFEEAKGNQRLIKAYAEQFGKLTFIFNEPTNNIHIKPLNYSSKKPWEITDFSKNKDTLYYWTTMGIDTLVLEINDYQTDNSEQPIFSDTVEIELITKESIDKEMKLSLKININKNKPFDINNDVKLKFSHPISAYDFSNIVITEGIDSVKQDTIKYEYLFDDKAMRKFRLKFSWKPDSVYHLFIPQGCFKDIFELANDSIRIDFKIQSLVYYGNIKLKLTIPGNKQTFIIQLLNKGENIAREHRIEANNGEEQTLLFDYLYPGKYRIKIIYDANNNFKWDTGNHSEKIQPEKVIYYPSTITIRSNWDLDLEWDVEKPD